MPSKYDDLDPVTELEQQLTVDLDAALTGRGCTVVHHGTNSGGRHSPGGKPDIEVQDHGNDRLILVEVTRRRASAAYDEFLAVTNHLERSIKSGGYSDFGMLYVSPDTSARLSTAFRDLWNRPRAKEGKAGRIVPLDFAAAELMLTKLALAPSELFPVSRFGDLFSRWDEAVDDSRTRLLIQQTIFPEDLALERELATEVSEFAAERERRLKKQLEKIEDNLRDRGAVGDEANRIVVYLTFIRLYEERRQRLRGDGNRFTEEGFAQWCKQQGAVTKRKYSGRMVEALLHEIAEDPDLREAGLLRDPAGNPHSLHSKLRDNFVIDNVLPIFDEYDFHSGRIDVLGAVFETLARRGEKDTRIGQFFTPQPVVDFCARLVPLRSRDVVLDPAVGTARFLIAAMGQMLAVARRSDESSEVRRKIKTRQLLGADIGSWVATIAKMNMYIHDDGKTNIRNVNGLALGDRSCFPQFPDGLSGRVDVVLTNPPLGDTSHVVAVEDWQGLGGDQDSKEPEALLRRLGVVPLRVVEADQLEVAERKLREIDEEIEALEAALPDEVAQHRLRSARRTRRNRFKKVDSLRGLIASGKTTIEPTNSSMKGGALFLGAIADYLTSKRDLDAVPERRGGWAAVVVDEAILNTPEYAPTREFIRDRFYVKAVVSLGRPAFKYLARTDAKTSILFLVRKPERGKEQAEPVFYTHAERVGYSPTGSWIGDDLPGIGDLYGEVSAAVAREYRGAHLDPKVALRTVEAHPDFGRAFYAMSVGGGGSRLDFFFARYVQRHRELRERYGEVPTLRDFLRVAPVESPEPNRRGEYQFAEVSRVTANVRPKGMQAVTYPVRMLWILRAGDLIVSGIDAVNGSVAVAGDDVDGMVMSWEMYPYCVREGVSACAAYLALLLRTAAAKELLMGLTTGTSNRTRLENADQLLDLPVPPLPDLEEQERRASAFAQAVHSRRQAEVTRQEVEQEMATIWPAPSPQTPEGGNEGDEAD